MWLLQALNLRLKTHPISGLDQAGKVRQPTFPFKSSSRSVLRPDTALMLECVPRSKSSDCNKSAPVVFLFFRALPNVSTARCPPTGSYAKFLSVRLQLGQLGIQP